MPDFCYMCDSPAVSREHVPPKCVFPAAKDTPSGKNFRSGLITVPACDEHNSAKAKDDEYLMVVLASHFQNNQTAQDQVQTKIARAWSKSPAFARTVGKNMRVVPTSWGPQYAYEVDTTRFNRSLEWAAHGLFFHEFGARPSAPFRAISYPLFQTQGPDHAHVNLGRANILRLADELFLGHPTKGANPEVFWYQISPEIAGRSVARMCFFEGFTVVAMSVHEDAA